MGNNGSEERTWRGEGSGVRKFNKGKRKRAGGRAKGGGAWTDCTIALS